MWKETTKAKIYFFTDVFKYTLSDNKFNRFLNLVIQIIIIIIIHED